MSNTEQKIKEYKNGVIVGRFQILHAGHIEIIEKAQKLCQNLYILVGSSQESGTENNPFSYSLRKEIIEESFEGLKVFPLPDIGVGNNTAWGDYVIKKSEEYIGEKPDVFFSGTEERRDSWFCKEKEISFPKSIDISSSKMKEFLRNNDRQSWRKYAGRACCKRFDLLRAQYMKSIENKETRSI